MSKKIEGLSTLDGLLRDIEDSEQRVADLPSRDLAFMLVDLRMKLNISQSELARRAGVSSAYISRLESGAANPSLKALSSLLRRIGVSLRVTATLAAPGGSTERTMNVVVPEGRDELTEGEMYHLTVVLEGLGKAIAESRLEHHEPSKDRILGHVAASYDAARLADTALPNVPQLLREERTIRESGKRRAV